jgi:GNAT superfamily N-acetyltransferase
MRRGTEADRPEIEAFLKARAVTSMFPLSNLARHGMDGDHARSMSFWVDEGAAGITDVIARTREGMILPSCDGAPWQDAARLLAGREAIGVIGARAQARPLIAALGLGGVATELDEDEPHFALSLADLIVPDGPGALVPMSRVDRALMVDWRRLYCEEVLGAPAATSRQRAEADIASYLEADSHRVLVGPDGPICATGFNAATPDIVQIGGVYTPKDLRGRGYARRAVALHLAEAREAGVASATLFASGASAVAAYEAIGFRRIGDWTIFITARPERIGD